MNLLIVILLLTFFYLTAEFLPKYGKIFALTAVLTIFCFYLFISANFFHENNFFPSKTSYICPITKLQYNWKNTCEKGYFTSCYNYYNILADSLTKKNLFLFRYKDLKDIHPVLRSYLVQDTTFYKEKFYLYFGITPVLLFYLPFHLVTGLYLTDKFLVFILSCISFLLSIFLIRRGCSHNFLCSGSCTLPLLRSSNPLIFLLVGLCGWLPFLIIRSSIYESAIITAHVLLLASFAVFCYRLSFCRSRQSAVSDISVFLLGLFLSLAVGARPHYVLFIPIFLAAIVWINISENKKCLKQILCFLIPCAVIGCILALYNYFRFDSIFNFGWQNQMNGLNQKSYILNFSDFWTGITNNLFKFPDRDLNTIFALAKTHGHSVGNEWTAGIFWTCPIIIFLVFLPKILKETYKKDIKFFIFLSVMTCVIIINMTVTSFVGMVNRYFAEYLPFMIILSLIIFFKILNETKNRGTKILLNILFISIFFYSVFMNTALLFSKANALYYVLSDENFYTYTKFIKNLF